MNRVLKIAKSAFLHALCLCLLLSGTALAADTPVAGDITQSQAVARARELMQSVYGLDGDMLRENFAEYLTIENEAPRSACTVVYAPKHRADVLGEYTVSIRGDGEAEAKWTHDWADPKEVAAGEWCAPAWGPVQLSRLHELETNYSQELLDTVAVNGPMRNWTLEERAALEKPLRDAEYPENRVYHAVPTQMDITQEDAVRLAKEAAAAQFGLSGSALDAYAVYTRFLFLPPSEETIWIVDFEGQGEQGIYSVELESGTGDVITCRALPAATDERMLAVGETPAVATVAEGDGLTKQEVIDIACRQLLEETGLTADKLSVFEVHAWYEAGDMPVWHVLFQPAEPKVYDLLGVYILTASAETSEILGVVHGGRG